VEASTRARASLLCCIFSAAAHSTRRALHTPHPHSCHPPGMDESGYLPLPMLLKELNMQASEQDVRAAVASCSKVRPTVQSQHFCVLSFPSPLTANRPGARQQRKSLSKETCRWPPAAAVDLKFRASAPTFNHTFAFLVVRTTSTTSPLLHHHSHARAGSRSTNPPSRRASEPPRGTPLPWMPRCSLK